MENSNLIVEINTKNSLRGSLNQKLIIKLEKKGIELEPLFEKKILLDKKSRAKKEKNFKWNLQKTKKNENSWDAAHELIDRADIANISYVEPDVLHKSIHQLPKIARTKQNEFNGSYLSEWSHPVPDDFAWYLKKTNLSNERHADPGALGKKVRIAHFDTGYDGGKHPSQPKYLNVELGENFIEDGAPTDKKIAGSLNTPGHGTATLALLAGNLIQIEGLYNDYMGGAPFAEIIPYRISNSVVLLKTVEFAKALQAAIDINCDVVTMSMGGLASKLWAEKINEAYEKGTVIVTAAGNNFGGNLPTHRVIYPARFNRVITACGVTHNNTPYYNNNYGVKVMMGNWGPQSVMYKAIGAYTPNVPWANMMPRGGFSKSGAGTSAATPQVAAAAALYIEKYKDYKFTKSWHKAEATRMAILESATYFAELEQYIGVGILNAEAAMKYKPKQTYTKAPEDTVRFPFFNLLFGIKRSLNIVGNKSEMFETELLQLIDIDPKINAWELENGYLDKVANKSSIKKDQQALTDLIKESKFASDALKKILKNS